MANLLAAIDKFEPPWQGGPAADRAACTHYSSGAPATRGRYEGSQQRTPTKGYKGQRDSGARRQARATVVCTPSLDGVGNACEAVKDVDVGDGDAGQHR